MVVNGKEMQLEDGTTVELLLRQLEVKRTLMAVERNREIVPRTRYDEIILSDNDRIEVVSLVGGG